MLSKSAAVKELHRVLAYWLEDGRLIDSMKLILKEKTGADPVFQLGNLLLVFHYKGASDAAAVGAAIAQARKSAKEIPSRKIPVVPVVAVPYMGDVGKRLCAEAKISWVDLSGNADLVARGLRIRGEGKPNKFTRRGRPSTAFGPRSARIARLLLLDPSRSFRQQELASKSGLDDGFVSRIIHRLDADGLIGRGKDGSIRGRDPSLLLDAWSEVYDFSKHTIVRGHVTAKTGEELLARLANALRDAKVHHAATGLGAAWLHTAFSAFRLVTFFVEAPLDDAFLRTIGFREEPKGANVWFVVPNDEGVFFGAEEKEGIACVHPMQAYLDLEAHPERAKEAAKELRARLLQWGK